MSNLTYLIPQLRIHLWDTDSTQYRYTDEWLDVALITAVKSLQRWWNNRYLVDSTNTIVSRNPAITFTLNEPEVIESSDERAIVLMAAILVKGGILENASWNINTWRDAEYYVSNIESGRIKETGLKRDWDELLLILKPPQKRLSPGARLPMTFGADETT